MSGRKLKKSVWLPLCLAIYGGIMTWLFAPDLIAEGRSVKLWVSIAMEVIVIIGLFCALRKKEQLSEKYKTPEEKY